MTSARFLPVVAANNAYDCIALLCTSGRGGICRSPLGSQRYSQLRCPWMLLGTSRTHSAIQSTALCSQDD
eukprot:5173016-Amphidinium_carterae.2